MIAALLTTLLWSLSVVFARRAIAALGSGNAYIVRQFLATGMLALYAHLAGQGLDGPGFWYFFFGGVVGFGLGDLAL